MNMNKKFGDININFRLMMNIKFKPENPSSIEGDITLRGRFELPLPNGEPALKAGALGRTLLPQH